MGPFLDFTKLGFAWPSVHLQHTCFLYTDIVSGWAHGRHGPIHPKECMDIAEGAAPRPGHPPHHPLHGWGWHSGRSAFSFNSCTATLAWLLNICLMQGRVIIVHDEVSSVCVADRKAIISKGRLRCVGSSLFLKNRFGLGYHLGWAQLLSALHYAWLTDL